MAPGRRGFISFATTGFNKHIYYPSWVAEKSMEEIALYAGKG